jgi:septal ring factor EnvC (AmiA/AmiB activator)
MRATRSRTRGGVARSLPVAGALTVVALVVVLTAGGLSRSPAARADTVNQLQQGISAGQGQIASLGGVLRAKDRRIGALGGGIAALQARLSVVQRQLAASLAQLRHIQSEYQIVRMRLARLEAYAVRAEAILSRQVVGAYEQPRPDLITVVLESSGLQSLLENLQFAQRVQAHDASVLSAVRAARRAVAAQATKLGALQVREQKLARTVLSERDGLVRAELALAQQQSRAVASRSATAAKLADAQAKVASLRGQLASLQAAQAAAQVAERQAPSAPSSSSSPAAGSGQSSSSGSSGATSGSSGATSGSSGSGSGSGGAAGGSGGAAGGSGGAVSGGGFTFPLPRSAASPPSTWSLDQGVDISAPGGTPEYAVCSGTIVLHGIGGFGPWAPVLHCDSPLDGYSYVYYGHAGPANQLPVGTHVGAGQVMSEVGPGIVGISSGPHVEMGFCDSSGAPLGGGTASTMLSLLHSAYGG